MSISDGKDYIEMNLIESATFNIGVKKLYEGVAGNLVAFACKVSFQKGYEGNVAFYAKNQLIEHYEKTLGAKRFAYSRMLIKTEAAHKLVTLYFKDFDNADKF